MKSIAIITGASSGMGAEFAKQISNNKDLDQIWIIARRTDKLELLAKEINSTKNFDIIKPVTLDISGKDGVNAFKKLLEEEDKILKNVESGIEIKLLINNAGFGTYGPFEETSVNREMDMIDLNCTALTGMCGVCLPYLKKGSVIINTASLASFLPLGNFAVYGGTKSYVLSFTMALAAELKDKGIKVCAMCPGPVSTEFANVASNGAREIVKHGRPVDKVVSQCLKAAYKGKKVALYSFNWKFKALASKFIGRYAGARFTYKYNPRPHNPDADMIKTEENISLDEFN